MRNKKSMKCRAQWKTESIRIATCTNSLALLKIKFGFASKLLVFFHLFRRYNFSLAKNIEKNVVSDASTIVTQSASIS